jgi:hypothetical protein
MLGALLAFLLLLDVALGGWGVGQTAIAVVIIIAIIAIVVVYCRVSGVVIPAWLVQIFWICVAACVAIVAIHFLLSL